MDKFFTMISPDIQGGVEETLKTEQQWLMSVQEFFYPYTCT